MESKSDTPRTTNWQALPILREPSLACVEARSTLELDDSRKWRMKSNPKCEGKIVAHGRGEQDKRPRQTVPSSQRQKETWSH